MIIKFILIVALFFAVTFSQTLCPSTLFAKCENEVTRGNFSLNLAYQYCEQAAKEKGQDQAADINCMKWVLTVQKDCWPCVCEIAKKQGMKIKGCDTVMEIIQVAGQLRK